MMHMLLPQFVMFKSMSFWNFYGKKTHGKKKRRNKTRLELVLVVDIDLK